MSRTLVLGTKNRKKIEELIPLLRPLGFELLPISEFPNALEVDETGTTFAENASLKASRQALALRRWVLGEDSGLSVDALDGAPGVYSARFSGPSATDASNNQLLLTRLQDVPFERRAAHYTCSAALANPKGEIVARAEDHCHGRIRFEPTGTGGFGYDPLFEVDGHGMTFGELPADIKAKISHRARAMIQLTRRLAQLLESGVEVGAA